MLSNYNIIIVYIAPWYRASVVHFCVIFPRTHFILECTVSTMEVLLLCNHSLCLLCFVNCSSSVFNTTETCRRSFVREGQTVNDLPAWKVLLSGGIGGISYWLFTYPTGITQLAAHPHIPVTIVISCRCYQVLHANGQYCSIWADVWWYCKHCK
jgi:hypothetical protein